LGGRGRGAPRRKAASSAAPLLSVIERRGWGLSKAFAALALVAVANGVLIQILMLARLLYGMARRSLLPSQLATVGPRHILLLATLVAGALVLIATAALPFASLLRLSTMLTLLVFVLVSLSFWRLQRRAPSRPPIPCATLGPRGGHIREYWIDSGVVGVGIGNLAGRPVDAGPLHASGLA